MITATKYNDPVKKMLIEARSSVDAGNTNRAIWSCLDALWYMLADNSEARERIKEAADFIYPKRASGKSPTFSRRERSGGYDGH